MQKAKNQKKTQRGREVKGAGQEGGPARLNGAAGMITQYETYGSGYFVSCIGGPFRGPFRDLIGAMRGT